MFVSFTPALVLRLNPVPRDCIRNVGVCRWWWYDFTETEKLQVFSVWRRKLSLQRFLFVHLCDQPKNGVWRARKKIRGITGVTKRDDWGKHTNHPLVSEANRQSEIDHINSFPVGDSHYCRAKTNKKYVGSTFIIWQLRRQRNKASVLFGLSWPQVVLVMT